MIALIGRLLRKRMGKGVRRGSSGWMIVGAFSLLRRMFKMFATKQEKVAFGHKLRPGEEMVLRRGGNPPRSLRKDRRTSAVATAVSLAREALTRDADQARSAAARAQAEAHEQGRLAKQLSKRSVRRKVLRAAGRAAKRALR